ncbi:MAG: hypothetical protein V1798_11875 [Pseudomonadota bacterium]
MKLRNLLCMTIPAGLALWGSLAVPAGSGFSFAFEPAEIRIHPASVGTARLNLKIEEPKAYIHEKAPMNVTVSGEGLVLTKATWTRKDAIVREGGERARWLAFEVPVQAAKAGEYKLRARAAFYYCTSKVCLKEEVEAQANVIAR